MNLNPKAIILPLTPCMTLPESHTLFFFFFFGSHYILPPLDPIILLAFYNFLNSNKGIGFWRKLYQAGPESC